MNVVAAAAAGTPSSVIISNVMYVVGAMLLAAIVVSVIVIRHRRPTSTEANMDTFHRGLAALAPGRNPVRRRPEAPVTPSDRPDRFAPVKTAVPRSGGSTPPRPRSGVESG